MRPVWPPPRWFQQGVLAFVTVLFTVAVGFMLVHLSQSDLPPAGRITASAFAAVLLLAVWSTWWVTLTYRRVGEPLEWRHIPRDTSPGRAFWLARRVNLGLFILAGACFLLFLTLALSGSLGGFRG
jgi:hypothetical protein